MNVFKPGRIAVAVGSCAAASAAVSAQTLQVEKLCVCWITSLSADGSAATRQPERATTPSVMRWTRKDGVKALGRNTSTLGVGGGTPRISADGKVVAATILDATGSYATQGRWTASGGWQELDHPLPPDGGIEDLSDADTFGMSADGLVVTGLYWRPGQSGGSAHAERHGRAATGMVGMPTAGGSSRIDGANRDGSVLSGWEEDPDYRLAHGDGVGRRRQDDARPGVVGQRGRGGQRGRHDHRRAGGRSGVAQRNEATKWTWNGASWDKQILGIGKGATTTGASYAIATSDDVGHRRRHVPGQVLDVLDRRLRLDGRERIRRRGALVVAGPGRRDPSGKIQHPASYGRERRRPRPELRRAGYGAPVRDAGLPRYPPGYRR